MLCKRLCAWHNACFVSKLAAFYRPDLEARPRFGAHFRHPSAALYLACFTAYKELDPWLL